MKIKLRVTCKPGDEPIYVTTNLLCIAEWERLRGRKMSDGRGVGATDMVDWAFFMLKQSGRLIKETEPDAWHRANPELDIEGVDMTDPNPTEAAPTAAS
jgi:hypothetical protein